MSPQRMLSGTGVSSVESGLMLTVASGSEQYAVSASFMSVTTSILSLNAFGIHPPFTRVDLA